MKINLSKIWNVFFNALLSATLILCIFMMVKYFYFKDSKAIELGNASDWMSSLSTFGTLIVAYMAYKAAPDWLNQKSHTIGIQQAEKVMNEVQSLKKQSDRLRSEMNSAIRQLGTNSNNTPQRYNVINLLEEINLHYKSCSELTDEIFNLKKWNVIIKNERSLLKLANCLSSSSSMYEIILMEYQTLYEEDEGSNSFQNILYNIEQMKSMDKSYRSQLRKYYREFCELSFTDIFDVTSFVKR